MTLQIVQDEAADEVLSTNAFALLCGMILQQQVPLDVAFAGPAKILDRLGSLDPTAIAAVAAEEFAELCAAEPAIHPYPESMSVLIQALARYVVVNYGGDTASMWETAGSGEHLLSRLMLMPGFNKRKAQMFVALLGKQLGVRPQGWEEAAGTYAQPDSFRSVADVHDAESLEKVLSAKSTRRKSGDEPTEAQRADDESDLDKESRRAKNVSIDDVNEEAAEQPAERGAGRKGGGRGKKAAAKKAARRAEKQERRRAEEAANPELAAERAAKRAARREAKMAAGETGKGRRGRGGKGKGSGAGKQTEESQLTDAPTSTTEVDVTAEGETSSEG